MDYYLLLRLVHIIGFISLGGGLLAVFVSELRAYRTADVNGFAEAAWYTATFYDALVAPGAVLVGLSGLFLIFELGIGFLSEPWLVGMWGLFLFEFIGATRSLAHNSSEPCNVPARRSKLEGSPTRSPRSAHGAASPISWICRCSSRSFIVAQ
jgi:hypothetical protein